MGRDIYEIHFKCVCGSSHPTDTAPKGFLNPAAAEVSVAEFYAKQGLPEDLKSFLAKPFMCPTRLEVVKLPALDAFFFQFTGSSTTLV